MAFKVIGVKLAAEPGIPQTLAGKYSATAETIEYTLIRTGFAAKHLAYGARHFLMFGNRHEYAPQVIAKRALIPVSDFLKGVDVEFLVSHFTQAAAGEIRLTADQPEKAGPLGLIGQGQAISGIQIGPTCSNVKSPSSNRVPTLNGD